MLQSAGVQSTHGIAIMVEGLVGRAWLRQWRYIICEPSVFDGTRQVNQPELISNHRIGIGGLYSRPVSPVTW